MIVGVVKEQTLPCVGVALKACRHKLLHGLTSPVAHGPMLIAPVYGYVVVEEAKHTCALVRAFLLRPGTMRLSCTHGGAWCIELHPFHGDMLMQNVCVGTRIGQRVPDMADACFR